MPQQPSPPVVRTGAGLVRGFWRESSAAFLGIPFAAAPIGPRRFLAPAPVDPWDGERPALAYGPTPQRRPFGAEPFIPEPSIPGDATLNLNVFTPAPGDDQARLPVLVWIHGGGYFAGSPASPWYDGRSFNRDGVVTVTLSYRLGFDGFGWIDGAPPNRGLLDQIAGLAWVQQNITGFGGDPARVTIGGQSAGGGSVLALSCSPAADGLFAQAIAQSGSRNRMRPGPARDAARLVADVLGVTPDLDGFRGVSEDAILDAQRDLNAVNGGLLQPDADPAELVRRLLDPGHDFLRLAFSPVVDGDTLLDLDAGLASGAHADMPILLGTTANEFPIPSAEPVDAFARPLAAAGLSPEAVSAYRSSVARAGGEYARSQILTLAMFRLTVARLAAARIAHGAGDRTWLYDFQYRAPALGVSAHCLELPFAWDLPDTEGVVSALGVEPPQELISAVHSAWTAFITGGTCPWPALAASPSGAERFDLCSGYADDAYALESEIATTTYAAGAARPTCVD